MPASKIVRVFKLQNDSTSFSRVVPCPAFGFQLRGYQWNLPGTYTAPEPRPSLTFALENWCMPWNCPGWKII